MSIVELRILPPFALARLGSSPEPMDNYDLVTDNPIRPRQIRAAPTLTVDPDTGSLLVRQPPFEVRFRDASGRIRPVAPFFEVWARVADGTTLEPLTPALVAAAGLRPDAVTWKVTVANRKAFRRTGDAGDIVEAATGWFGDFVRHELRGTAPNFFDGAFVPFGHVQGVRSTTEYPEIRMRFTPAAGLVYGPPLDQANPGPALAGVVYDPAKGRWPGYVQSTDMKADPIGARRGTNPELVYFGTDQQVENAGQSSQQYVCAGYLDDECDGIVDVALDTPSGTLTAFARISVGPPTFAPDSLPLRTVADELEQALAGPDFQGSMTDEVLQEVMEIVRRALEGVSLMNTAVLNEGNPEANVGMARDDFLMWGRVLEPIVDPSLADNLAIRARHERVLQALESGSLAWFARVLREYDQVADLSADGRRRMPAMMRGADGNHLALTRLQVSKVRAAAELVRRLIPGARP
jgi:hypothetical protein